MEKMQGCSLTAHFGRQRGQVLIVFVTISNSIKSFVLILHTAYFDAGRAREGPRASWYSASVRIRPPRASVRSSRLNQVRNSL